MKRDPRNLLAVIFVLAGVVPIVIWLGAWAQRRLTIDLAVQIALAVVLLVVVWRIRTAWEKKHPKGRKASL
jgi:hypothetical protein